MIDHQSFDSKELTLKQFSHHLAPNRLFFSSILFAIFAVLTVMWIIFTWRYNLDYFEVTYNYKGLERLISGGTTRSLTIEGGQWWRIFSYGLAMNGYGIFINIFVFITLGLVFWKMLKFNEAVSGSFRTASAFFSAYLLNGFVLSVLGGPFIYGSFFAVAPIVIGMVVGTINNHKNQVFDFIRSKLIWPIFLFIFLPLLTSPADWISIGFGFVIGMAMMNLIYFRSHRSSVSLIFSASALAVIFILSLIFTFVPLPYGLAKDYVVIQTLYVQSYYHLALSPAGAEAILARLNWGKFEISEETVNYMFMFQFLKF